jgi:quercetin dioxygenase-like cupin family protein
MSSNSDSNSPGDIGCGGFEMKLTSMRLAIAVVIAAPLLVVPRPGTLVAQEAPVSTPVRTVLALAILPSVVEAPMYFKLSKVELGAGNTTKYAGPIGFVYVVSGSLTVQADAGKRTLKAGDALLVTAGSLHSFTAASTEPALFVHWVLGRADELNDATEREPALVTELYRNSEPIPELKSGPYEFTLTRVTFPPRMAPNVPHYRSGAALYYILEGSGSFVADGRVEARAAGMPHFEPHGWVHRWGNPGDEPLVLLQANISEEGVPAVILVQ